MIPEIGHFSLIVATALSFLLAIFPLIGAKINHPGMINSAKPLAIMQFLLMSISFSVLAYSFATDDFSVGYVATNSNSLLPFTPFFSIVIKSGLKYPSSKTQTLTPSDLAFSIAML